MHDVRFHFSRANDKNAAACTQLDFHIGTTAAMLVGTSAPETYSKFGLDLRRLERVRYACWYVRSNACWYMLGKKCSSGTYVRSNACWYVVLEKNLITSCCVFDVGTYIL